MDHNVSCCIATSPTFVCPFWLLLSRLSSTKSKCVRVALRAQFVEMVKNDLQFVFPDQNGERICQLACQQLGYTAVKVANKMTTNLTDSSADRSTTTEEEEEEDAAAAAEKKAVTAASALPQGGTKSDVERLDEDGPQQWATTLLAATTKLVTSVQKSLDACRQEQIALPAQLNLALSKNTQFIDGASVCLVSGGGGGGCAERDRLDQPARRQSRCVTCFADQERLARPTIDRCC